MKISARARAPSHDPAKRAIWTLDALKEETEHFMTEVFVKTPHEGMHGIPKELFDKSLRDQGNRPARYIAFDDAFRTMTMPIYPRQPTIQYSKGIKVNYFPYWSDDFKKAEWRDKKVTVRIDPDDASYVTVLLGAEWVRAECPSPFLRGLSQRDLQVLTEECRAEARVTNRKKRLSSEELEEFIARIRRREVDLRASKQALEKASAGPADAHSPATCSPSCDENGLEDVDFTPAPSTKVVRR